MEKWIRWTLVFLWALLMFGASADSSSGSHSLAVLKFLFGDQIVDDPRLEAMQLVLRKLAHLTEYAVLAALVCFAWGQSRFQPKVRMALWAAVALFAVSDEFHQSFVPGRAGTWEDVLIDSCGAALACVLVIRMRWRRLLLRVLDRGKS